MAACLDQSDFEQWERGVIDDSARQRFGRHVEECATCKAAYDRRRRESKLIGQARDLVGTMAHGIAVAGTGPVEASDDDATIASVSRPSLAHIPKLEGYRILGVLGQGGMGIVYRAVQTKLNRAVALKLLPAIVGSANPQAVTRFRREAAAAARLHHSNIIPIYDFGESHQAYYYAMELVTGMPLNDVITQFSQNDVCSASPTQLADLLHKLMPEQSGEQLGLMASGGSTGSGSGSSLTTTISGRGRAYYRQVARWTADAADALHYAHGEGIIHRDIKPANFILSVDGRIMVADFGLAMVAGEESMTMSGSLVGTLRYMSPEQAMAKRMRVDFRTDIWSLGAVLYELLTFQPAFSGLDHKEVLGHIITREPTAPHKIIPSVPRELELICLKTLEKNPGDRYPTARALAEDLRCFINDRPINVKPPGFLGRSIKFIRRHKTATVSAAALVLALLLLATAVALQRSWRRNRVEMLDRLVRQGHAYAQAADWPAAEAAYDEAKRIDANYVPMLVNLAIEKKDRYNSLGPSAPKTLLEEADALCRRAIDLNPEDRLLTGALNAHGVVLKKLGRFDDAVNAYTRARDLKKESFSAWENLGIAYAHLGDLDKAEELLAGATELGGREKLAVNCWRNLASLHLHRGDKRAPDEIDQAIGRDATDRASWMMKARVGLASGDASDAAEALDDAKHADRLPGGDDPRVKRILALAFLRNREYSQAGKQASLSLKAGDLEAINDLILSLAYAGQGDANAARAQLFNADQHWPDDLKGEASVRVSSDKGILWFDSAAELRALRAEVEAALSAGTP